VTVEEAMQFFSPIPQIRGKLETLRHHSFWWGGTEDKAGQRAGEEKYRKNPVSPG